MARISITHGKGIHLKFNNGICMSIQFGAANYCEHYDARIGEEREHRFWESFDAELAVWDKDKNWYDWEREKFVDDRKDVKGYVPINEVLDLINKFRSMDV